MMSLRAVTWKEKMDEWHEEPHKLLAWLTKLFWDAQISPDKPCCWLAQNGEIRIGKSVLDKVADIEH